MPDHSAIDSPGWRLRAALGVFAAIIPLFGALVVWRSAYMSERHTDFEVYARAGWAIRNGVEIYDVTDSHGLHYCYPPTFAILMSPLADPPPGADRTWCLPFGVSVGLWFAISVLCLLLAVHLLASAVESTRTVATRKYGGRWWSLRLWPILLTLPEIGGTLSHGQVNLLVLLLLCGMTAAAVRCRTSLAGLWLSGAVSLKVIPAFLGLVALRRRDWKWSMFGAAGLAALLFGLPAIVMGPAEAAEANRQFLDVMIHPAMGGGENSDRAKEMFHVLKTDNQSLQAVFHAWRYWLHSDPPAEPDSTLRTAHWLIGAAFTIATLVAARGRRLRGNDIVLFVGALTAVMLFVSPMCHLHYYCLTLPLVLGLVNHAWEERGEMKAGGKLACLLAFHVIGGSIPLLFDQYRNLGFAPISTIPLWAAAVHLLARSRFERRTILPLTKVSRWRAAA